MEASCSMSCAELQGEDDGYDGYDEMQKLLTGPGLMPWLRALLQLFLFTVLVLLDSRGVFFGVFISSDLSLNP